MCRLYHACFENTSEMTKEWCQGKPALVGRTINEITIHSGGEWEVFAD